MILKDLHSRFVKELSNIYEVEEIISFLQMGMEDVLKISYQEVKKITPQHEFTIAEIDKLNEILIELKTNKPIQHILGYAHFYGQVFKVNESVLIPRPETEELVDWIINDFSNQMALNYSVLDIGTGSGCIPIIIKKHFDNLTVSTLDVSPSAIEIAKENARQNHVNINFIDASILTYSSDKKYDIVVSNPPYIRQSEKKDMHQNVINFEPHLALFVSNDDPLIFYNAIANFAQSNLIANGAIYLEINECLGKETIQLLSDKGFINIELKKDMQGKDRMIRAYKF